MQSTVEKYVRKRGKKMRCESCRGHCRKEEKCQGNACFPVIPGARSIHCHGPPQWACPASLLLGITLVPCDVEPGRGRPSHAMLATHAFLFGSRLVPVTKGIAHS